MKLFLVLLFLASVSTAALAAEIGSEVSHYHGYQVIRANASTVEQRKALIDLQDEGEIDFWSEPSMVDSTDIMVSPSQAASLRSLLEGQGIKHSVMIEDLETLVASERIENQRMLRQQPGMNWEAYHDYNTIMTWLDSLPSQYPIASVQTIGRSSENREIKLIKISRGGNQINKTAYFVDGGFHAREWISPATVTYFINELLTNPEYDDVLNHVDFYIAPLVNPDGYEFTITDSRMWRKTRSRHDTTQTCYGVDPNRNFGHEWGGAGTSTSPCSDIYKGPHAFSEPEAQAIRDYLQLSASRINWQVYISVHSYGQWVLIPWSYAAVYPPDFDDMQSFASKGTAALTAVHGTRYVVGQSAVTLSPTAGSSDDWAHSIGIKYAYTYEVRDTGRYGFVLPPDQIIPTAEETTAAFKVMAQEFIPAKKS